MQYSNGNKRTLVRPPVMFKEMGLPEYNRGPYLGEQTENILKEYGYSDEEVAKLLEEGAAIPMDPALRDEWEYRKRVDRENVFTPAAIELGTGNKLVIKTGPGRGSKVKEKKI